MEVTFAIIRPHIYMVRAVGAIIHLIEDRFQILGMEQRVLSREFVRKFYEEHLGKPFFDRLVESMLEGPSICLTIGPQPFANEVGSRVVDGWREMIGATDPEMARPFTIRARYGTVLPYNAVHGSDSIESARREIGLYRLFYPKSETIVLG